LRSTARNFFVVWRGWKTGVFYQWRDCKRAIQGFVGAQFKGFQTLDGAEEAFAGGNAA
jgi:ribonuclease HI